tara:strand:- start:2292 stop:2699 length:408 start_codon:yes stop_codon:yes gene_type:complete
MCINSKEKQNFFYTLEPEQKKVYTKIINERKTIYYIGFAIGIIISIILLNLNIKFLKVIKSKREKNVCFVVAITFIINYLFYTIYPKSNYMILHLNDKQQVKKWLNVYLSMQLNYHLGFVFGIIAVGFFANSYCS